MTSPISPSGSTLEGMTSPEGEISSEEQVMQEKVTRLIRPVVEELSLKLKTAVDLSHQVSLPLIQVVVLHLNDACQENIEAADAARIEQKAVMDHISKMAYDLAEKVSEATEEVFSMTTEEKLVATQAYGFPSIVPLTQSLLEEAPEFVEKLLLVYPQET